MTGSSDAHYTIIASNLCVRLRSALRGGPCCVYDLAMRLRPTAADAALYPDLMVTYELRDNSPEADSHKRIPRPVVEVLSESTAADDRGHKFELYHMIDTLQEVLRVEPDRRPVDLFRREAAGRWLLESHGPAGEVPLASVGVTRMLDSLYEDAELGAG